MPKGSGGGGGGTAHIDVYARVRPSKKPSRHLEIDYAEHAIAMKLERKREEAVVNNQRENYSFAFSRVLDMSTTQDTVFETVARPVVDSVLDGYNGTIFAYGQTGSGKTFTITGGAERYVDRGIIPRALSYIFGRLAEQRSEYTYERRRAILSAAQFSAAQFADGPFCRRTRSLPSTTGTRCGSRTSRSTSRRGTTCSTRRTRRRGWRTCRR